MSLLQALKLPVSPHFLAPSSGSAPPAAPPSLPKDPERRNTKAGDKAAGDDAADPHAEAKKLRGAIEARRKQSADLLLRMQKAEPVLKAKVDAATGAEKKTLADKQALLIKQIADAERAVTRAQADLEAIDNPGSKREELMAILARQRARGKVAEATEITSAGLDPYQKGKVNSDVTATTTAYADGKATTEKVREQHKVGLDGYTKTQSRDKEVTDGNVTARAGEEKKANVSLGGKVSVEEKKSAEIELRDGRKAGVESTQAKEISAKGASQTQTVKKTNFDGSSSTTTAKQEVERGDGKVVAKTSGSVTTTSKSGTATTSDKSASGGLVAGKDGYGAKAGVDGGKSVTTKKGRHAGVVAGLHANVSCKVGEPSGEPKVYPVTVTVSFGGSAAVSGGAGKKEGSKASVSVEIKGSVERSMVVTHNLGEAELADYTQALEAASKGSKVAATQQEFAIIATGVKQGWDVAREMWESGGKEISKKTTDNLKRAGDSAQVSEIKTGGIGAKGSVGPVGGGYSVTDTKTKSTKATRNEKGGLDVEANQEEGRQKDVSVSMQVGVAGLEVGTTHVHKTRFGYSISIEPKDDPDGKLLAALNRCETELEYEMFIMNNVTKVKVQGRTKGRTDAEGTNIGVSVGGAKLKLGTKQGIDRETTTDGTGKVVGKKTTGSAGAGGELVGFADSVDEDAAAVTDGQGNSTLTLTRTQKQNYGSRVREKKAKKAQEKLAGKGKASGALSDASGGEDDDSATQDVSGLILSNKDLRRLGQVAVNSMPAWMGRTRRWQEKEDWKKAGLAIARAKASPSVVAHELAAFIGGDRTERLKTVELFVRGGYQQTTGKAFEFPDSLRDIRDDYNLVTDDTLADKMNAFANKKGDPAAAKECERLAAIADRIQPRIQSCNDFANKATKTEMLKDLFESRKMLARGVKGYGGNLKPEDDPKVLADEGDRLMKLCTTNFGEQMLLMNKMQNQDAYTVSERTDGLRLLKQLEDMHHRWWGVYLGLKENYAKRKLPFVDIPHLKPQEELVATFEKKFRR